MQYEELEKKNSIRSWALDLCNKDAGIGNSVNFIKYLRNNPQIAFPDLYPSRTQGMQWGTQKTFVSVELIMNMSKILFFPATIKESLVLILVALEALMTWKAKF